jgi:hypothetical protein
LIKSGNYVIIYYHKGDIDMEEAKNDLKLIKDFMLKQKDSFGFIKLFAFMKENNIEEYATLWIAKEELKEQKLIIESYDSENNKIVFTNNR